MVEQPVDPETLEDVVIRISTAQLWVHDQDEALAFWSGKVGFEVRQDVTVPEMGNFRWLTVGPADQEDIAIVLMAIPGPPVMDAATHDQVAALMAKGFAGTVFLTTDDVVKAYESLSSRESSSPRNRSNSPMASTAASVTIGQQRPTDPGSSDVARCRPSDVR